MREKQRAAVERSSSAYRPSDRDYRSSSDYHARDTTTTTRGPAERSSSVRAISRGSVGHTAEGGGIHPDLINLDFGELGDETRRWVVVLFRFFLWFFCFVILGYSFASHFTLIPLKSLVRISYFNHSFISHISHSLIRITHSSHPIQPHSTTITNTPPDLSPHPSAPPPRARGAITTETGRSIGGDR